MSPEPDTISVMPLEALEPGNYFPLALGSEELRQNALYGLVASWGARRPFYIRQNGVLSVMCGRLDAGSRSRRSACRPG